jgi:hypothetical protein
MAIPKFNHIKNNIRMTLIITNFYSIPYKIGLDFLKEMLEESATMNNSPGCSGNPFVQLFLLDKRLQRKTGKA